MLITDYVVYSTKSEQEHYNSETQQDRGVCPIGLCFILFVFAIPQSFHLALPDKPDVAEGLCFCHPAGVKIDKACLLLGAKLFE